MVRPASFLWLRQTQVKQPAQGYIRITYQLPARPERRPTGAVLFRLADAMSLPIKRTSPSLALLAIYKVSTCYQRPVQSVPSLSRPFGYGLDSIHFRSNPFALSVGIHSVSKNQGSSNSCKDVKRDNLYPAGCLEYNPICKVWR